MADPHRDLRPRAEILRGVYSLSFVYHDTEPRPSAPGQMMVLDNHGAHKDERVRELIEGRGYELLFLPPYSPELNSIEEAFRR